MTVSSDQPVEAQTWLVLGMHRSGTSLLTHALSRLGGYVGPENRLLAPTGDNPEGFFELTDMVDINGELLARGQGDWVIPPRVQNWESARFNGCRARAQKFIARDFKGHPRWLFKDPRLCLTLGFWTPLLPNPKTMMCLRRPSAVCRSLNQRNGLAPAYSRWLWAIYVASALEYAETSLRGFVFYEDFLQDPVSSLMPWVGNPGDTDVVRSKMEAALAGIVKPGLNHADPPKSDPVDSAYEDLRNGPKDVTSLWENTMHLATRILADGRPYLNKEGRILAKVLLELKSLRTQRDALERQIREGTNGIKSR